MTFGSIRDDIVGHLENYIATKGADCEEKRLMIGSKVPKSSFIARMLKAKIQPPSTNTVIFSPSKYSSPSENRLEYIESDEEDASDMEVVESTQRPEDEMSLIEDNDDDGAGIVSLVPLSGRDELELIRMVRTYGTYRLLMSLLKIIWTFHRQAATEPDVNIIQRALQHGWKIGQKCLNRVRHKVRVCLKRTAHCFSALTDEEMSQYLKGHPDVCHLSPSMKNRDKTVDRLIELRLPAPEWSTNLSTGFRRMLYELMTM